MSPEGPLTRTIYSQRDDKKSRAGRTRTRDKGIMLPTTAFTASFEFVVWTVSSLYEFAVQSLHLSAVKRTWLGISLSLLT